jgi:hypothetical protein
MRLEAILKSKIAYETSAEDSFWNNAIRMALHYLNEQKPSELADLMRSFCEGGIETESAETWSKKWGQVEPNKI